jgi:DNA invertase Pin-like site-specific DNA recombinase
LSETLHIYTRVSTISQEEHGTSLETQKELGIKRANSLGFSNRVWNEGGQSSSKDDLDNRPILVELLSLIDEGSVRHLYVFNTDRLSRNQKTWGMIRYKLNQNKILLYTGSDPDPIDLQNPMDDLLVGLLSEISQYDNKLRKERFRLGKLKRVKLGGWFGGPPPYGYKLEDGLLLPEPNEVKWVNFIFQNYRNGKTLDEIRDLLLDKGVLTRRNKPVWSHGSINKLLQNTHYVGYFQMTDSKSGETVKVNCEPIVSPTLVKECNNLRKKRSYSPLSGTRAKDPNQKNFYLLKSLLVCGSCGSRFHGKIIPSQYRSIYYCPSKEGNYKKTHTSKFLDCKSSRPSIKIGLTDELIWNTVVDVVSNSHLFKEDIKNELLGSSYYRKTIFDEKKSEKRLKLIEKDIENVNNKIIALETEQLLQEKTKSDIKKILKSLEEYKLNKQSEREELIGTLDGFKKQSKWVYWVKEFSSKIENLRSEQFTPQMKLDFLSGIVDKITVNTVNKNTHELVIHFYFDYVKDGLKWKDLTNKSLGYNLTKGSKDMSVQLVSLKKELN